MYIDSYEYRTATIDCLDHLEIEGIDRESYAVGQFIELMPDITLSRNTAVLYAAGVGISQSESRTPANVKDRYRGTVDYNSSSMLIKEISAYNLHKWIGSMENNEYVVYANVNSNTCASSMHSIYEADRLLSSGACDEVIIIAEERTSFNTIRIFKEHGIPITVADGIAVIRLSNDKSNLEITDTKWGYEYNRNPFGTTDSGYAKVDSDCNTVKVHGTYTANNNIAESTIYAGRDVIYYKSDIGHTQGVSALIELCMAIDDDNIKDKVLCVASGLGGFYGSCILNKAR